MFEFKFSVTTTWILRPQSIRMFRQEGGVATVRRARPDRLCDGSPLRFAGRGLCDFRGFNVCAAFRGRREQVNSKRSLRRVAILRERP
jgi:hypothetical protein